MAPEAGGRGREALDAVREGHRIAHAIVARAEAQAREILESAREQGLEAGRRAGLEQSRAELESAAAALGAAAARYADLHGRLHAELHAVLPAVAVEIAAGVLRRELALRPEALVELIRQAIAAVTPAARMEIRVHPDDLAVIERHRGLLDEALAGTEVRFEPSPTVGRGGCFIETEALTLGAGVAQQLERALALLTGEDA